MGDLRDSLLKAGLVSAEAAKKAEESKDTQQRPKQPPRPPGNKGGPRPDQREGGRDGRGDGGGREHRDPRPDLREPRERPAPKSREPASLSPKEAQRLLEVAQAGKVEGKTRGQRRWYFVSRAGLVPFLEVSDEIARELEQGNVAIAESERGDVWLVTGACAKELEAADPAWVRT